MKVHLIDGTYELCRAHFGSQGWNGIKTLMGSLALLLRQPEVTHVAFAFDTTLTCFRNDMYFGYKTGDMMEPDVLELFPAAERLARAMGIVTWSMIDFEADDAMATGARIYAKDPRVDIVYLCTRDKDLHQCMVDPKVLLLDRMNKKVLTRFDTREKYGVPPECIPDYLALVGDKADGIPGLPNWGAKSAGKLITHYGQISHIPDYVDSWTIALRGDKGLADILRENRDAANLYKELATLRTDVPITESVDDLFWDGATDDLEVMCEEYGMSMPQLPTTDAELFDGI